MEQPQSEKTGFGQPARTPEQAALETAERRETVAAVIHQSRQTTAERELEKCQARAADYLAQLETRTRQVNEAQRELNELRAFLEDSAAYARWQLSQKNMDGERGLRAIASTLLHDIAGLVNRDECFSPRVSGYAAKEAGR